MAGSHPRGGAGACRWEQTPSQLLQELPPPPTRMPVAWGAPNATPSWSRGSHSSFPLSLGGVIKLIINHYMPLRLIGDEGSPRVVQVLSLPGDLRPGWFLFFLALCDTK